MKKRIQRIVAVLLALSAALCGPAAFALEDAQTRTVRVGFYRIEGYNVMDEAGNRSGYGYEVLQAMKLYNNWVYEYIGYDKGWADIQQMMLSGEIDMVISAVKTPERMEKYDFSDRAVSQSGACLMVKAGESPYVAGQYDRYSGMRVGFIENASQIARMEAFAAEKGFTYTPVYYKTSDELENAILSGVDVDAIVTSNMRIIEGTRRLELFAMQDVHAMVRKGDAALLAEINYALEQISLYSPGLYDSLYNKYYSVDAGDEVFFSPEESRFIAECRADGGVLRVSLPPEMSPYAYYEGDAPAGILYDIAAEILRRTGLQTELIVAKSSAEYRELVRQKDADLLLAERFDYNYAESLGYTLIDPYYTTDVSRVTRKGYAGGVESIAVVRGSAIETYYLPQIVKHEKVVAFDTVAECARAVLSGSCDALYLYTRTAQEIVYTDVTNRLTSVIMPRFTTSFTIAVREEADARLASILEKAGSSLSEDDVAELVLQYTDYPAQQLSFVGMLYNDPVLFIAIVALLLIVAFSVIMLAFIARKRKREREKNLELQAALASAERANAAKSVFMSRMSHEIRTPLNAIIGYNTISAEKLSQARDASEYRQAAMKAMDCLTKSDIASKHLLTVINDVLDMSAIESGKIKIAHEPFDFKSAISGLSVMFYAQAKAKNVEFEVLFDTPADEWFVGDQMRLNQILTNLLSNAVKFTPSGGRVRLAISQREAGEGTARLSMEVADTGIGMSSAFLENIWKPFEQADASISRRFGGTGLGLSITKNLVELMGGEIRVESEEGAGTTFTVELELTRMRQPAADALYDFSGVRALIADDDESTCDYLKLLFDRCGVRCTTVTNGQAAVDAVMQQSGGKDRYTVCLLDWHMPGSDTAQTIRRIREIAGAKMPVIVISAYDRSEIEPEANAAGMDAFIAKPLFQSAVFDLLADISGRHGTRAAVTPDGSDFHGARVLLAEDNKMNMEIAKAILSSWNLQVDEAWNGGEAVDKFCAAPAGTYGAILMDVHMPELDGYRATQAIRASAHAEAATIPIIAMTADVFAEDVAEAMAAGMNAHIGKPIDRTALHDVLKKYIVENGV